MLPGRGGSGCGLSSTLLAPVPGEFSIFGGNAWGFNSTWLPGVAGADVPRFVMSVIAPRVWVWRVPPLMLGEACPRFPNRLPSVDCDCVDGPAPEVSIP